MQYQFYFLCRLGIIWLLFYRLVANFYLVDVHIVKLHFLRLRGPQCWVKGLLHMFSSHSLLSFWHYFSKIVQVPVYLLCGPIGP